MADKKKIAILGGGMSSLVTAFLLTEEAGWQERYDITLYQLGWRLGGKGASGRNLAPEYSYRIEEHGIHIFFGFYDNAFQIMQRCYAALGRPADAPLATWEEAWQPSYTALLMEKIAGSWHPWEFSLPANAGVPGSSGVFPTLHDYVYEILWRMLDAYSASAFATAPAPEPPASQLDALGEDLRVGAPAGLNGPGRHLHAACELARRLRHDRPGLPRLLGPLAGEATWLEEHCIQCVLELIVAILRWVLGWLWTQVEGRIEEPEVRKLWAALNFAFGNLHGAVEDRLFTRGLASINDREYAAWLAPFLVPDGGVTRSSALVRWIYDAVFGYPRGDMKNPNLEAGTALLANLRIFLTYKGAPYYKMQAGMGDVVFAPLYLVLKERGVRFEFFHRVVNLGLSDDQKRVETIEFERQVELLPEVEAAGGYAPLVTVKGLPCWPATPLYDQIVGGRELAVSGIDLESYSAAGPGAAALTLRRGADFDDVVLGISLGALPCIGRELLAANPRWRTAAEKVETVATQAFQLWFKRTLSELGGSLPPSLLAGYDLGLDGGPDNPINSWADMTQVLDREGWPAPGELYPQSISYFCCPLADPPTGDPCNPDPQLDKVKRTALDFITRHLGVLLPGTGGPFDWDLLVDNRPEPGQGPARFDSQFWTSIENPSDRYVLSVTGSSRQRLPASGSGFENLYPTGDWIDNTLNVGCVEGATMSAMATANAMTGSPPLSAIVGWGMGSGTG